MYSMNYIGKFISNFRDFYNEINAATLTGAIDVIVVEQDDGSYTCSPFHVRFGKLGVLRSREKVVDIEINGEAQNIHMKLGDSGEAFFVEEVPLDGSHNDSDIPPHLACSPIPDDNLFPQRRFQLLSNLPKEQHEKILRDSVLSIEREKLQQMSLLPSNKRENYLIEQFPDLPAEYRDKWLKIEYEKKTYEEKDEIFREILSTMSTLQKQQMIRDKYSSLKIKDREDLFKKNFPELPAEQRPLFEKALLNDWRSNDDKIIINNNKNNTSINTEEEEIFDMENIDNIDDDNKINIPTPKSFIAVTSTDRIRKISVVNNDFIPINDDTQSSTKEKSSDESNTSIDPKKNKDEIQEDVKITLSSSKRKRKRKSIMKKKGSQRKASNGSSSQTEISENDGIIIDESINDIKNPSPVVEDNDKIQIDTLNHASPPPPPSDYHFFSDTEVTKNRDSRPSSPVQSDTEFEMRKIQQEGKDRDDDNKTHQQSWRWGELPSPPPDVTHSLTLSSTTTVPVNDAEAQRSMLSGMFSFMKKTSRVRHNPESEGIYLSDINADELDPEVAALYFPSSHRESTVAKERKAAAAASASAANEDDEEEEEDTESGNGPSLPQSPNSVDGAIGGCKMLDSDYDEHKNTLEITMSLCGGLDTDTGPTNESFIEHQIHYDDICNDIKIYDNPNLVIKINGKYYNWMTACPIIVTLVSFQRYLPQNAVENLLPMHHQDDKKENINNNTTKDNEARSGGAGGGGGYSSWFSWRRSTSQPPKKNIDINEVDGPVQVQSVDTVEFKNNELNETPEMTINIIKNNNDNNNLSLNTTDDNKIIKKLSKKKSNKHDGEGYSGSEDSDSNENISQGIKIPKERRSYYESNDKYRKTLRLSSEQIASLNLKEGPNEVVFSVTTAYQGTSRCKCHIYKWRWDDKIVISDIDGTITKSDVLGHILPIVGKDWAQSGVAQLFTKIKNNGYRLLYLSARAIGQARVTREYLKSIKQDDLSLPEGPLLLNPTSLISAFHREVIEKKPERFKISCLSDIQALFPDGSKPFYAGYGNRINDVWAYRAVGIPIMRIFTINHRGELKHELTQTFQSSYACQSDIVNDLFPPMSTCYKVYTHDQNHNNFIYK
ncbi:phosphatidate phosphatase LPIN1 isoform X3 [Aphidius gifuensis]|uniref:phosphatidate phosphatase LPIN1 isoform X3 n=1 Tax=Aphidius gifuensis TaxID=684658 RepID=UPI001CDC1ED2|nr:phosphatidate phosphatase LPIN1 isoform X3 [Aphidius gifuensis]